MNTHIKDVENLEREALAAAKRGDMERADEAELEHIRRTRRRITLIDGRVVSAAPESLVHGYGQAGQLAVAWCTMDGTKYTDIDGKEIT